jgi:hypothetical protein
VNQPNLTPTRKVTAAGIAGAATIALIWALSLVGVDVPAEAATAISALLAFGAGYLIPEPPG